MTYNTWSSSPSHTPAQSRAVLSLVRDAGADIVLLQEVSPSFFRLLCAEPWLRAEGRWALTTADEFFRAAGTGARKRGKEGEREACVVLVRVGEGRLGRGADVWMTRLERARDEGGKAAIALRLCDDEGDERVRSSAGPARSLESSQGGSRATLLTVLYRAVTSHAGPPRDLALQLAARQCPAPLAAVRRMPLFPLCCTPSPVFVSGRYTHTGAPARPRGRLQRLVRGGTRAAVARASPPRRRVPPCCCTRLFALDLATFAVAASERPPPHGSSSSSSSRARRRVVRSPAHVRAPLPARDPARAQAAQAAPDRQSLLLRRGGGGGGAHAGAGAGDGIRAPWGGEAARGGPEGPHGEGREGVGE